MSDYTETGTTRRVLDWRLRYPCFPTEIFEQVAEFLFALVSPATHDGDTISLKPHWGDVAAWMESSVELHAMGFVRWIKVLKISCSQDWNFLLENSHLVLELDCRDGAFSPNTPKDILTQFKSLRAVRIDSHADVVRRTEQFAYRNLFTSLPPSLLRLEIANAHGPDLKVIQTAREHCPNLVVLRLGRCTMFNRVPACEFWKAFSSEHDAYIAAIGTDDFAHSVAQELVSLTQLKTLRIAVYFMHSTAVLAHRVYHIDGLHAPAQVDWQQAISRLHNLPVPQPPARLDRTLLVDLYHQNAEPNFGPNSCRFCHEWLEPSRAAEERANVVIKRLLPNLETVEWMDWFSDRHLGVHPYSIRDLVIPESTAPP